MAYLEKKDLSSEADFKLDISSNFGDIKHDEAIISTMRGTATQEYQGATDF